MNFLGHALLSLNRPELLAGNMIGDFVKGKIALEKFPAGIRRGIVLHRKIDTYTDSSPSVQRAQVWFRQEYRLYSGAIVDILFDHYLATDPHFFRSEHELLSFSQEIYSHLAQYKEYFPEKFAEMYPFMVQQNWLYNYRTLIGTQRSLNGLHRRAKHMKPIESAYSTFVVGYYEIGQCYQEFIGQVYKFVNDELRDE